MNRFALSFLFEDAELVASVAEQDPTIWICGACWQLELGDRLPCDCGELDWHEFDGEVTQ